MKRLLLISFAAMLVILGFQRVWQIQTTNASISSSEAVSTLITSGDDNGTLDPESLRTASAKAIKVIQHSQSVWYQRETCTSCHHQILPEIPLGFARERGVPFDERLAKESTSAAFAYLKDIDGLVQGYDYIDVVANSWGLVAAHAAGISPNLATTAEARFIASRQLPGGNWPTIDVRPPQSSSEITTTAVCARALSLYLPEASKSEKANRLGLARHWLLGARPRNTEERTYQLFGLHWTGAGELSRKRAARRLLDAQHEDGGWAQMQGLASDAYSTGEALVALNEAAGLPTTDPAYQRGLKFLLKTQQPDGSWFVRSRLHPPAPVSPPYVNVDFPPGNHDQFISAMGTSWSASALMLAIPSRSGTTHSTSAALKPAAQPDWVRVALTGSAAALKELLDAGMDPNSKTSEGTTALMMSARDPLKIKLLIERGADVNARAASGFTALMVAARYRGNAGSIRLLMSHGAKPNLEKGIEVRNEASALFFAVMAGDLPIVKALGEAGAGVTNRMKILGTFYNSPLLYAMSIGDIPVMEYLITKGANVNEVDDDGISILAWAAISNRAAAIDLLARRGAKVNSVDRFGMTPLLYAASIDFGDTSVVEKLVAFGADAKAKNKEGMTALDLTKNYHYAAMANLLSEKPASR